MKYVLLIVLFSLSVSRTGAILGRECLCNAAVVVRDAVRNTPDLRLVSLESMHFIKDVYLTSVLRSFGDVIRTAEQCTLSEINLTVKNNREYIIDQLDILMTKLMIDRKEIVRAVGNITEDRWEYATRGLNEELIELTKRFLEVVKETSIDWESEEEFLRDMNEIQPCVENEKCSYEVAIGVGMSRTQPADGYECPFGYERMDALCTLACPSPMKRVDPLTCAGNIPVRHKKKLMTTVLMMQNSINHGLLDDKLFEYSTGRKRERHNDVWRILKTSFIEELLPKNIIEIINNF